MTIYWIIIIISLILILIRHTSLYLNKELRCFIIIFVITAFSIIYIFRSLTVGKDYFQYYSWYSLYNLTELKSTGIEVGYAYLSAIAKYFNSFKIIPIFTIIIVLFSILCVKRYTGQNINSFTLLGFFILLGIFTTMFNPIRESIAFGFLSFGIAILLIGLKYHSSFLYIFYLVFIFIASKFHGTGYFGIIFLILLVLTAKHKYTKRAVIIDGILMLFLSFTGIMNTFFTKFISLDSRYSLKYQNGTLNVNLPFIQLLIKIAPLFIQLIFLYIFVSIYNNINIDARLNFVLWGYLFYLFMFTAPGSNIARRLQIYTFIFPVIYSCLFVDGIIIDNNKVDKISKLTKFLFISFWLFFYILRLYFNASGIVPYSFI